MKHRILLLNTDLETGGTPHYVRDLAVGLDRDRFQILVACLAGNGPVADQIRRHNIKVHCLGAAGPRDVHVLLRLADVLYEFQPHLIHASLVHANFAARLIGRFCRVPRIVATIHTAEQARGWHLLLENAFCRWSDLTVCVSSSVRDHMCRRAHLPAGRLHVIPNGVDIDRFRAARPLHLASRCIPAEAVKLIFVGRLDPVKNLDTLLRAFVAVKNLVKKTRVHLIVVGDGPERQNLQTRARISHLSSHISFVGEQSNVEQWLRSADIYVQPSKWEGMSLSTLEAMAAGLPILATDVPGLNDLVDHGKNGYLVPPDSSAEIMQALKRLVENPRIRREFGKKSAEKAEKNFSRAKMLNLYTRLYQNLLVR